MNWRDTILLHIHYIIVHLATVSFNEQLLYSGKICRGLEIVGLANRYNIQILANNKHDVLLTHAFNIACIGSVHVHIKKKHYYIRATKTLS